MPLKHQPVPEKGFGALNLHLPILQVSSGHFQEPSCWILQYCVCSFLALLMMLWQQSQILDNFALDQARPLAEWHFVPFTNIIWWEFPCRAADCLNLDGEWQIVETEEALASSTAQYISSLVRVHFIFLAPKHCV